MRRGPAGSLIVLVVCLFVSRFADAAPPSGAAIYAKHCAMCHDKSGETRAPARSVLATLTVERIVAVMSGGTMKAQAAGLSESDRHSLASFLSSKHGAADVGLADSGVGQCVGTVPFAIPQDDKQWTGWGPDLRNSRFQP